MSDQTGVLSRTLGPETISHIWSAAGALGCPEQVVLAGGFALLLHRLSEQAELTFGYFTAEGKSSPETSAVLPIESILEPGTLVADFLKDLSDALSEIPSSHPSDLQRIRLTSSTASRIFELSLAMNGPSVACTCYFSSDLLDRSTVSVWLDCWIRLLQGIARAPESAAEDLRLLSSSEEHKMTVEWNRTDRDRGVFHSVPAIFRGLAQAAPQEVALECAGVTWTNSRLLEFADGLATRLRREGVSTGSLVAIAIERSPEMLGSVLAVLMAGAAYLPLDPRHPQERNEQILSDSGATFLLANKSLDLKAPHVIDVLQPYRSSGREPLPDLAPDSLAYVIYTSGSTGQPKGVAVEHGALMNLLLAMAEQPGLTRADTLVSITTLAFDIATMELLLPLITGAKLVIATDEEAIDGRQLLALLERSGTTFFQATPGHWRLLLLAGWSRRGEPSSLAMKCLCGGEPLTQELAEKLLERTDELWNVYGPTETTIWSSATRVSSAREAGLIGPPIANTQFYVLDAHRRPVPPGVRGELFIGGTGLARGYWQRPDLTAARFVPNPYRGPDPLARMYATGDLARFRSDGKIVLLGRADHQVKIRGYRIELGEIESALAQDPRINECVVVARTTDATEDGVRLVAFVVLEPQTAASDVIDHARSRLTELLPAYMLPWAYQILPRMPRTPNGKVDRKAFPEVIDSGPPPDASQPTWHAADHEPEDLVETQIADIWQRTLGLPDILPDTNFFSLGLGSFMALRLITRINGSFGMNLGIASLVSAPTIESLAELVRLRYAPNTDSTVVALRPGATKPPLFLVHGVGGNIVTFYGLSARLAEDQPVYAVQAQSLVGKQPALLRMEDMAACYIRDIRKVQPQGPYHLVGYSFGGKMALEIARQLLATGEKVNLLGMIDSRTHKHAEVETRNTPVQTRFNRRMTRFRGNTVQLPVLRQINYVLQKLFTRCIRLLCVAACDLRLKRVPSFMRSTWDINHVASMNYVERAYPGRIVLFLPSEQPAPRGPLDLGWSEIAGKLQIHELPGDHDKIFLEPNIDLLASSIAEELRRSAPMNLGSQHARGA